MRVLLPFVATLLMAASPIDPFPVIDKDEDGLISEAEYDTVMRHIFRQADADFDGSLTAGEQSDGLQQALLEADMIVFLRAADTDRDGLMSEAELIVSVRKGAAKIKKKFENEPLSADLSELSEPELKAWQDERARDREAEDARLESITARVTRELAICQTGADDAGPAIPAWGYDCDKDGSVSFDEFRRTMRIRFHTKDADGDGHVSEDERPMNALFSF